MNLDARIREMWRELFTASEVTIGTFWADQSFKIRGATDNGNRRRKNVSAVLPSAITIFDPMKVTPLGSTIFNQERLACIATRAEAEQFDRGGPSI